MRTRMRKILSDVRSRKMRTGLVSASIFIGVFGTVALFSMGDLLVRQLEKDLDKDKLAMVRINLVPNPDSVVDNERLLATLRSQTDVTMVEGQAVYPLTWKENGDIESSTLFAYSEAFNSIQLEPMRLEAGAYPQTGQNELMVEQRFAEKHNLKLGSTLTVRTLTDTEETWTIVGIVFFPYGYPGLNDVLPEDSVFATYEDAQHIAGFAGFSSIYARYVDFKTADQQADTLAATIAAEGSYIPILTYTENPDGNSRIQFARTISGVMATVAMLALIVAGFLVLNVITTLITEQKQQIGVLKSLGASRGDILFMYLGIAVTYGLIGIIPGVMLGIPMGYVAAQGLASTSNTIINEFDYSLRAIGLGMGLGIVVPMLAAILPVLNSTRVRIIDAITDLGISSQYGHGILSRFVGWLPLPINVRQGVSNVLRKKGRMTLTGVALTVAVGAFMGVFATFASVSTVLDEIFGSYHYQIEVTPNDASDVEKVQALIVDHVDEVTVRGPSVSLAIDIEGFDKEFDPATGPPALFASGFDPAYEPFALDLITGEPISERPEGVIISRPIADWIEKGVGDTVVIYAGGASGEVEIVGIAAYPFDAAWFDWHTLADLAGFTDADGDPMPTGLLIELNTNDPSAAAVADKIDDIKEVLLANGITASYGNIQLLNESIAQLISVFQLIFNFAALLIAVVGAIGLLTTLAMSVFERQKEIGVMRSVGAGSNAIMLQFLAEGILVGIFAWVVAIPLSYGIYTGMLQTLNLDGEYQDNYSLQAIVIGFVGVMVITTIASIWPSIAAARKTVSDILRYQ